MGTHSLLDIYTLALWPASLQHWVYISDKLLFLMLYNFVCARVCVCVRTKRGVYRFVNYCAEKVVERSEVFHNWWLRELIWDASEFSTSVVFNQCRSLICGRGNVSKGSSHKARRTPKYYYLADFLLIELRWTDQEKNLRSQTGNSLRWYGVKEEIPGSVREDELKKRSYTQSL